MLQNDNLGITARQLLPRLLSLLAAAQLSPAQQRAYAELQKWNYHYEAQAISPSIFELWYLNLVEQVWDDEFGSEATGLEMRYPSRARTNDLLLRQDTSRWLDDHRTPQRETLPQLALESFRFATDSLTRKFGPWGRSGPGLTRKAPISTTWPTSPASGGRILLAAAAP
nr:penicillin acylase family protein [Hymenobacter sp. 5516J-16]